VNNDPVDRLKPEELDKLIDSWADPSRPLSKHLELAVSAAMHRKRRNLPPLRDGEPVPGCDCVRCLTYAAGGTPADADEAEEAVRFLAHMPPADRIPAALGWEREREEYGRKLTLPRPSLLARLAAAVPGAIAPPRVVPIKTRQRQAAYRREPLNVEAAKAVPILEVARRLGLEPVKPYPQAREWVARCPFHIDNKPSLRLDPKKSRWFCSPCDRGGDGIRLFQDVRGLSFPDTVRELVA
jgi:hypothetical protein